MTNTVLETQLLPDILFRLIRTEKVLMQESNNGVISLTPVRKGSGLRGIAKTSKLTTEKLLAFRLEEKEREK